MKSFPIFPALLLLLPATTLAAEPDKEALAIVDKAITAQGGAERLAKVKAETWKAKGSMTAAGMSMTYTADYTFAGPDKMRFDLDMELGGMKIKLSAATDGKEAWEQMPPMIRVMTKEKQAEFHHSVYVMNLSFLTPLKDKAYTLTSLGESKVGEQAVVGIKVTRDGHRDVSMYFDKKTGLLAKTSTRVNDEFTMKEVTQDVFMTGFRDKDGVKFFDKLTIQHDGKDFIIEEMSEQKTLEKIDEKLFAKPAGK